MTIHEITLVEEGNCPLYANKIIKFSKLDSNGRDISITITDNPQLHAGYPPTISFSLRKKDFRIWVKELELFLESMD